MIIQHRGYILEFRRRRLHRSSGMKYGYLSINGNVIERTKFGTNVSFFEDFVVLPRYSRWRRVVNRKPFDLVIIYLPQNLEWTLGIYGRYLNPAKVEGGQLYYETETETQEVAIPPALLYRPSQDWNEQFRNRASIDDKYIRLLHLSEIYWGEGINLHSIVNADDIDPEDRENFLNDFAKNFDINPDTFFDGLNRKHFVANDLSYIERLRALVRGIIAFPLGLVFSLLLLIYLPVRCFFLPERRTTIKQGKLPDGVHPLTLRHLLHVADRGHWFEAE